MTEAYFDNAATTPVSVEAASAIALALTEEWGNPSAANGRGTAARRLLDASRAEVMKSIGAKSGSLVFTSSGTESDNLAILGYLTAKDRTRSGKKKIITTEDEHPAVMSAFKKAAKLGFETVFLSVKGGIIDFDELCSHLDQNVSIVSVMLVNNETGAMYPLGEISNLVKDRCPSAVVHTDAVQGYMKTDCSPGGTGCGLISVSGHKIGGPKGVGALWISDEIIKSRDISPLIFGGGQESGLRSGTENMPGIAGMAAAAASYKSNGNVEEIRKAIISSLPEGFETNVPAGRYIPHILSIFCAGIKSEVLVRFLSARGVYVSSGSACSSKKLKTSRALTAFGLSDKRADSTIRISISEKNTVAEANILIESLNDAKRELIIRR